MEAYTRHCGDSERILKTRREPILKNSFTELKLSTGPIVDTGSILQIIFVEIRITMAVSI